MNRTVSARLIPSARYETQLVLGPKVPLKAPSIKKADEEIQKLYETSPTFKKFVKDNELYFGANPTPRHLNRFTNTALVDDDTLFEGSKQMRVEVKAHFQKLGYNSLLDMNDIGNGLAKTPLVVFDPEKTLRVVSKSKIDAVVKEAAKKTYKENRKLKVDQ